MALHIDQFVTEVETGIKQFAEEYKAQHEANPEHFPLELGDDNSGLWIEFFFDFMAR